MPHELLPLERASPTTSASAVAAHVEMMQQFRAVLKCILCRDIVFCRDGAQSTSLLLCSEDALPRTVADDCIDHQTFALALRVSRWTARQQQTISLAPHNSRPWWRCHSQFDCCPRRPRGLKVKRRTSTATPPSRCRRGWRRRPTATATSARACGAARTAARPTRRRASLPEHATVARKTLAG